MDLALAPLTITIVIATMAITIVAFRNERLYERFLMSVDAVLGRGEWWRMLTAGFLHADWPHLLANMFSLFAFGGWLEHSIQSWRLGLLYGNGILVASFTSVVLHRHAADYRAVGASGGVCAVIGGSVVIYPDVGIMVFPLPIPIPGWIFGSLFVIYSVVGAREQWDNVGHAAHLGGTLFGIGLMVAFYPQLAMMHWMYILAILASGGIAYSYVQLKTRR